MQGLKSLWNVGQMVLYTVTLSDRINSVKITRTLRLNQRANSSPRNGQRLSLDFGPIGIKS